MEYIHNLSCKFPFPYMWLMEILNSTQKTLLWLCTTYINLPQEKQIYRLNSVSQVTHTKLANPITRNKR